MNQLVLIVDDEPQIVKLARDYLEASGFRVESTGDGAAVTALVKDLSPDAVVLDLNLPGIDGFTVCRDLRRFSDVPILMLTARVDEADRLIGLELGADDYITKPFSPRELVARVRAVLRRVRGTLIEPNVLRLHDLVIDRDGYRVEQAGELLHLTPIEFALLALLSAHPGQTLSRDTLMDHVYGAAFDSMGRSIDAHVKNLRRKLGDDPNAPRYIETIYGIGYRMRSEP